MVVYFSANKEQYFGGFVEIRMLKHLFDEGFLRSAIVVPAPMESDRWHLVFEKSNGGYEKITKSRTDVEKNYKRLNGALADAQEIGFKKVTIEFN